MKSKFIAQGIAFIVIFLVVVSLSFGIFSHADRDIEPAEQTLIQKSAENNELKSSELETSKKDLAKNSI